MFLSFILKFSVSIILGFLFWIFFAGKCEGDKVEKSFRPKIGAYRIHIHHWIWCGGILMVLIVINVYNPILLGLLIGSIVQGFLYKDRFVIFYKDSEYKNIYSKFKK
jgi:hypothetical protein